MPNALSSAISHEGLRCAVSTICYMCGVFAQVPSANQPIMAAPVLILLIPVPILLIYSERRWRDRNLLDNWPASIHSIWRVRGVAQTVYVWEG